jgi:hypothetical protein
MLPMIEYWVAEEERLVTYSTQQLEAMDRNEVTPGHPIFGGFLADIFSKLPDDITEWVYSGRNCCFVIAPDGENTKALHAAREDLRPHIVILPCDFLKRLDNDRRGAVRTLLHEVAHGYLNHRRTVPPEVAEEREHQADDLAGEWLESCEAKMTRQS